jgi:hypothetical protein
MQRHAPEKRPVWRAALTGPITPELLREALRSQGPETLACPRVQAQLEAWWVTMQLLPRHVEWSGRPYAHASKLDFVREAREGLLGISEALIVKVRPGRPRRPRLSPEGLRSGVRVVLNVVKEGRRTVAKIPNGPAGGNFLPGLRVVRYDT